MEKYLFLILFSLNLSAHEGLEQCHSGNYEKFIHDREKSEFLFMHDDGIGCFLHKANLAGENFRQAILLGADLIEADLSRADLCGADLSWAWLNGAKVQDADFSHSCLLWADLENLDWQKAKSFAGAVWGEGTKLPEDLDPDKLGMVRASSCPMLCDI